jgi:sucrose-phosphate synthase
MPENEGNSGLYIMLLSVHGLIRGEDLELGRDPDTGGQVTYVLELARQLVRHESVRRVDLVTRRIHDSRVDESYAQPIESIGDGAQIVRIDAGPRRYLRKERLWPYLDAMTDRVVTHISDVGRLPDIIHGHYADAGYVGSQLARLLGVPLVFTGHSLGRVKRERLRSRGQTDEQIESKYNISRRIEAEEFSLETASMVVTSTGQEVDEQYSLYDHYNPRLKQIIPPGIDLDRFHPPDTRRERPPIAGELKRFLEHPNRPMILTISRADERKNISTLVEAYATTPGLKEEANLVILAGNRDEIRDLDPGARKVMRELLLQIDKYDLYGHIAYPKHHEPEDVAALYRLAARSHGVFVNPALTEPFGLTLLEAAASGLPIVATNDGGPQEIIDNCENGLLVDPMDPEGMGATIKTALEDRHRWKAWSRNGLQGVHKVYAWKGHVQNYLDKMNNIRERYTSSFSPMREKNPLPTVKRLLICDIDNTLLGDSAALKELMARVDDQHGVVGFGIATGRHIESAMGVLREWKVRPPDLLITDVGSEIQYGEPIKFDDGYAAHINDRWEPNRIREALSELPGLSMQPEENQRRFKISYELDPDRAPSKHQIERHLRTRRLRANVIHSHDAYLDILPIRASKGLAVRYLALKWGLPFENILVAGDSGNDADMLAGDVLAVVVGNHSPELKSLHGKNRVFFAEGEYAQGVLEGIDYYNFFGDITIPEETYAPEDD